MAKKTKTKSRKACAVPGQADGHRRSGPWTPANPSDGLIDDTLAVWQPRSSRALSREDAREIIENVAGFFAILQEWDRADRGKSN